MTRHYSRQSVVRTAGAGTVAGLAGCLGFVGGQSPEEQAQSHRDTLSKYTDVAQAKLDGYRTTTPYIRTEQGILGMPFYNRDAPELDPEQPTVLFYNIQDDGSFSLLGAKWLVPTETTDSPPSMFGKEFQGPTPGETALIPEHYGLRVWLFEDNPNGLFARYHGRANPPSFIEELETAWEALTPYYSGAETEQNGYTNLEECVSLDDGAYPVPFVNTDNTRTDVHRPGILLYRLTANWSYNLMGAEGYVPADSTDSPPPMFGQEFHGPMDGHRSQADQPEHSGLHMWLFNANPNGLFARDYPTIRC